MQSRFLDRYGVYIFFISALLPVLLLRDFTPANELRYVSIASDALRDGNIFTFTNQGVPYSDKPPLYLWIVMGAYALLGTGCMWLVGLFSAIPAMITTELTIRMCGDRIPESRRNTARLTILASILFLSMAFTMRMDMLMVMFIAGAIYNFMQIYRGEGNLRKRQWLVGICVFMALFSKGPLGVLVPLAALAVFLFCEGSIRQFGRYWGWRCWLVLLAGCALWWGCAFIEGGWEYIDNLLFHQTIDRAVDAFHHKRPWYFYLVQMWWCMAPWSLLLVAQLFARLYGRKGSGWSAEETMCAAVVIPTFIMLSSFSSKLPVYLLPISTFWAAALFITTGSDGKAWQRWLVAMPAAALTLAGVGAILLAISGRLEQFGAQNPGTWTIVVIIAAGLCMSCAMASAVYWLLKKRSLYSGMRKMAAGLLCTLFFAGLALPSFNHLIGLDGIAREGVMVQSEVKADRIVTLGMKRSENIDVYFRQPVIALHDEAELQKELAEPGSILLICPEDMAPEVSEAGGMRRMSVLDGKGVYYIENKH